jgi:hypothetical protein
MNTLSYGFKQPETGDLGSVWFPALEDDIEQLNDHTHNGTNSSKLATSATTSQTSTIASGSWSATSGGTYKQTITLPAGLTWGTFAATFILTTSGHVVHPVVEKVSSTSYDVYTNDNSLGYTAIYVS